MGRLQQLTAGRHQASLRPLALGLPEALLGRQRLSWKATGRRALSTMFSRQEELVATFTASERPR